MLSVEKCKKLLKIRILSLSLLVAIVFLFYNNYTFDKGITTISRNIFPNRNSSKFDPPGVIVEKVGGLGNQLFRYACSFALAKNLQVPLYLEAPPSNVLAGVRQMPPDKYSLHGYPHPYRVSSRKEAGYQYPRREDTSFTYLAASALLQPNVFDPKTDIFYKSSSRPYVLHKFGLVYDKLVEPWNTSYHPVFYPGDVDLFKFYQNNDTQIQQKFRANDTLIQINGYCQAELFFKNYTKEIRSMFQLQLTPEELARPQFRHWINAITAAGGGSVGVHVRRGDYVNLPHWSTPYSFYHVAFKMMLEKLKNSSSNSTGKISFFVFSDDINLVKRELFRGINLPANVAIHFVSCSRCTTHLEEFYLMTLCRHMINANSTFSWWAAWLIRNDKKIIIAPVYHPKVGYAGNEWRRWSDAVGVFYPKEWIVLDPFNNNTITRF